MSDKPYTHRNGESEIPDKEYAKEYFWVRLDNEPPFTKIGGDITELMGYFNKTRRFYGPIPKPPST